MLSVALTTGCGARGTEAAGPTSPAPHTTTTTETAVTPATANDAPAVAAMMLRTWSRPGLSYRTWWGDLEPLLSAQARQDLAATDPAQVPALRVTGPARLRDQAHHIWARVSVPTSIGVFGVQLTRPSPHRPWLVDRLDFPPGVH